MSNAHVAQGDIEKALETHLARSNSTTTEATEKSESTDDGFVVKFATPYDADNPLDWPQRKKWLVTGVLSATGLNRITVSTIMAPALPVIAAELHMTNTESVIALSVYLLATAFGPLLIGPLSEIYGREVVLHATAVWFAVWNLVCGFAQTKELLIAARFLAGFGASAIYTLAGGVLGDLWRKEERGRSLGAYILVPLLGAAIGPIVGGFITEYTTWRWMFWSTSILQAVMIVGSFFAYSESYAPIILRRKAKKLRKQTGDSRYHVVGKAEEIGKSPMWILQRHLTRPFRLLMFHPIIQVQAVLSGFSYGITYLVIATFSDVWTTQYHETIAISGLHYISMCLGEIIGAQMGGRIIDLVHRRLTAKGRTFTPESRMLVMLPTAILVPAGLLIYGWAAQTHQFWLVVDLGAALQALGLTMGGQGIQAYVIDSYPEYTSSAAAASQFLRSLAAFGFPLFAPRMYKVLGYGWGNTLLAFLSIGVLIPSPLLLWKYGPKLRERAASSH